MSFVLLLTGSGVRRLAAVAISMLVAGCSAASPTSSGSPSASPAVSSAPSAASSAVSSTASPATAQEVVWLCRPGLADNPCEKDLTATAVNPDRSLAVQTPAPTPAADAPIDCFYIYPTVSAQTTHNSDLKIEASEIRAARAQASPFSPVCRVFAPMYRSLTSQAANYLGSVTKAEGDTAYDSVKAAFDEYLAKDNAGRGIVFIGHSQGAWMLTALLKREFDANPARRQLLVSAIAVGGNIAVPAGKAVGGDFANIPTCSAAAQTGCVVAYSSFWKQPPADAWFGRANGRVNPFVELPSAGNLEVMCVNPAAIGGGSGVLQPRILAEELLFQGIGQQEGITTPWVAYPDMYSAQCQNKDGAQWLQISLVAGSKEARPIIPTMVGDEYGMHNVDIALASGNLVELVRNQAAAFGR